MSDEANLDLHEDGASEAETAETLGPEDELERLRAENAALKDQLLRVAADAENAKRRAEKSANDARAYAIEKFARDLLGAADNLSRALLAAPKEGADPAVKNLVTGIDMTEKALQGAFERNGLKMLAPERGARFDPHYHQAMMEQAADDVGPGAVLTVMQPGYELFGRLVRPAMVVVTPKAAAPRAGGGYAEGAADTGAAVDAKA